MTDDVIGKLRCTDCGDVIELTAGTEIRGKCGCGCHIYEAA